MFQREQQELKNVSVLCVPSFQNFIPRPQEADGGDVLQALRVVEELLDDKH
jgi:hypothetical protein